LRRLDNTTVQHRIDRGNGRRRQRRNFLAETSCRPHAAIPFGARALIELVRVRSVTRAAQVVLGSSVYTTQATRSRSPAQYAGGLDQVLSRRRSMLIPSAMNDLRRRT
jgi:hypothetical protein